MKPILFALGIAALLPTGVIAGSGSLARDCYCTDKTGSRVELGETICLNVDGRSFLARCEMSLNVPMWRETGKACLSSQNNRLPGNLSPAPDGVPVTGA